MDDVDQKQFKKCTKCKQIKHLSLFFERKDRPNKYQSWCKNCKSNGFNEWRSENMENERNRNKEWYSLNMNVERARASAYRKNNSDKVNFFTAIRRAAKINATPIWLSQEQKLEIKNLYKKAKEITVATGTQHVVDHIVPLQGKIVTGLHVPWNLQILTASENNAKHNKFIG